MSGISAITGENRVHSTNPHLDGYSTGEAKLQQHLEIDLPWLTIIIMLISFVTSKKSGASNTKALVTAGLAGAATYYVSHETEWGKANIGSLDGVLADGTAPLVDGAGTGVTTANGTPIKVDVGSANGSGVVGTIGKVLESWGGTGTAAVIGTTVVAGDSNLRKWLPWLGLGALAYLFLK